MAFSDLGVPIFRPSLPASWPYCFIFICPVPSVPVRTPALQGFSVFLLLYPHDSLNSDEAVMASLFLFRYGPPSHINRHLSALTGRRDGLCDTGR